MRKIAEDSSLSTNADYRVAKATVLGCALIGITEIFQIDFRTAVFPHTRGVAN